jgi:hypothetical protein
MRFLAMYGCIATGLTYASIGVIAILSFLKLKDGGADESSLFIFMNGYLLGKIFIWIVLLGTAGYICWRIYEAIYDPYDYGRDFRGFAVRIGVGLSTIADLMIVYSSVAALFASTDIGPLDELNAERAMIDHLLHHGKGWLIIITGVVVCFTAIVQFWYGVKAGYKERINIDHYSRFMQRVVRALAFIGYVARGIILAIAGFFFIKAAVSNNPHYVVNTDKAFDFIGDHVGHTYFILVAIGTICYGLFMFAHGLAYDIDKD